MFQSISRLVKIANRVPSFSPFLPFSFNNLIKIDPQLLEPSPHDPKPQEEEAINFQKRAFGDDFDTISNSFKQGIFLLFHFSFLHFM